MQTDTRRSLIAKLFALPALSWLGRSPVQAAASPTAAPLVGPFTDEELEHARIGRDVRAANCIRDVIHRDRIERWGTPLIACEGDYVIESTCEHGITIEKFVAGFTDGWKNENDLAIWRGQWLVAIVKSTFDGKPVVVMLEENIEPEWTVPDSAITRWLER